MGEELRVPDYAHASREVGKLKLQVKNVALNNIGAGKEILFDSTGVIYMILADGT